MMVHGFRVLSVGRHGAQERLVHILTDQEAESVSWVRVNLTFKDY